MMKLHLHGTAALLGTLLIAGTVCPSAASAAVQWTECCRVPSQEGNASFVTAWSPRKGLRLRFAKSSTGPVAVLTVTRKGGSLLVTREEDGRTVERPVERARFNPDALPGKSLPAARATVKFRADSWAVYIENRLAALMTPPLSPPLVLLQTDDALPAAGKRQARFQKTAPLRFRDDFLSAPKGDNPLAPWKAVSGTWSLHAAFQGSWQGRVKKLKPGEVMTEFSPNFYNLGGKGNNAVIIVGHPFHDRYSMQASVQVWPGEMGLVFYFADKDDYFAFTIRKESLQDPEACLKLWRALPATIPAAPPGKRKGFAQWSEPMGPDLSRRVLAAVTATIVSGQWVMPRVVVSDNRIRCFLDKVKVIDLPADLPPGGRFGLYADSTKNALFDDVSVESGPAIDFTSPGDFLTHALYSRGDLFGAQDNIDCFPDGTDADKLTPPVSDREQILAMGATNYAGRVFSARFEPQQDTFTLGLVLGFRSADKPYRRFVWERRNDSERCRLEQVSGDAVTKLDETAFTRRAAAKSIELTADPTRPGELRMYRDKQLVLVDHRPVEEMPAGASGLYIGPNCSTRIVRARYTPSRDNVYRNTFSEKQRFTEDPYMRHWSSPEGEWYEDDERNVWHKSDFFGAFSLFMPVVQNSEIHLGVHEGRTDGEVVIAFRNGKIIVESLNRAAPSTAARGPGGFPDRRVEPLTRNGKAASGYVVHCEDYWLWVAPARLVEDLPVPGTPLLKYRLERPLAGRRIRIAGFRTAALTRSRVTRYRVKDYLFTEAPHEWVINGGHWQIVNRFQCDPRWTHMNGESAENLAALWTKYRFGGDFCVELYAGIRHGWYDRCGDLNLTVMADKTSPSRGYTVTCTGWDFDHSQELTKLYRNGKLVDKSDAYLVPRYRDGNKRINVDPLIKQGRDVHGAWYYIKFRRIGKQLEYHFDNQRVFATKDDSPIADGRVGLWTFMNSMVIARMKISAEKIEPVPFDCSPVVVPPAAKGEPLRRETSWSVDDPIACSTLSWHRAKDDGKYFVLQNTLGSGRMFALCDLPPVPLAKIAGWTFLVKRTPGAQFNFHYSVGHRDRQGEFIVLRRYFHRISGTDFSQGPASMAGSTPVPPIVADAVEWHTRGKWARVSVTIPVERFRQHLRNGRLLVKLEGFGNFQPSYILQGLFGNAPGESYAVKDIRATPYAPPPLRVACEWSKTHPNAIVLHSDAPYTDRRLAMAKVSVGKTRIQIANSGSERHVGFLPYSAELVRAPGGRVPVSVAADGRTFQFSLDRETHPFRSRPVLVALEGLPAMFENFEARNGPSWVSVNNSSTVVRRNDRTQGNYLEVRNTAERTRLRTSFKLARPPAQLPVLQFRYRATPLVKVSLSLPDKSIVRVSENYGSPVRHSAPLLADWQWRTWHGIIADAMKESAIDMRRLAVRQATMGSCHKWDQTGRYSYWYMDDVVFGPAVGKAEQLKFTPRYFAFDGVDSVSMTLLKGEKSYYELEPAQVLRLEWKSIANNKPVVPSFEGLQDGLHHLVLKATDVNGTESSVTDIPFLLDTKPMEVFRFLVKSSNLINNQSVLNVLFLTDGGAPPILDNLEIRWNDKPITIDFGALYGTMSSHGHDIRLSLNWPYVFRKELDAMKDGDEARIGVVNITDGAGNVTRDVFVPIRIDYKKDKNPPHVVPPRYRKNVLLASTLQGRKRPPPEIALKGHQEGQLLRDKNGEPYLTCPIHPRIPVRRGMDPPRHVPSVIYTLRGRRWDLSAHPYVSFRMRVPSIPENKKASISLMIQDRFLPQVIPLLGKPAGRGIIRLPEEIEWQENEWQDITVDLFSLLKRSAYDREFKKVRISKLAFVCDGFDRERTFHLQNLYIYAALPNPPTIKLDAYDASGIEGFSWIGPDTIDDEVHGRAFYLGDWAQVRAHDKAGNVSPPLRAPLSILPKASIESRLLFADEDE